MFNLISLTVFGFLFSIGHCDMIGQNRLGNNVLTHRRFRNDVPIGNYEQQISNWMAEQRTELSRNNQITKKRNQRSNKHKHQNRLTRYIHRHRLNYVG